MLNSSCFAQEQLVQGSRYLSARSAGTGESALTLGEDTAFVLFSNPADAGRIRKWVAEPLNFSLNLNHDYIGTLDPQFYQVTSLSAYAATLRRNPGARVSTGGAIVPSIAFPNFAFGILLQSQMAGESRSRW